MLGLGCAFFFASSYAAEPFRFPAGGIAPAFPPWQSVQPRRTVPVVCIEAESVCPWQATQPALARSASSCDSPSRWVPCCWPSSSAHKNAHPALAARPMARLRMMTDLLESESDIREDREQSSIGGNIAQPLERHQSVHAAGDGDVLGKRRPVRQADPRVGADTGVNAGLEQQQLQWIGARKAQQIQIHE